MVCSCGGILYGIAGVLLASRIEPANALSGQGMELDAIAAVTVGDMILGVLTLRIINYGMTYLGVDSYYQLLVKGSIIILC